MWWTPWDSATACSMRIEGLLLEGFRNYDSQQLTFDESCNVIYGDNAQGKTNLLEAIVYLSCGRSPRTHADRELIGFGTDRARLVGQIRSREREFETEIQLTRGRRRKMTINGVAAKNGGDLSQVLHTVFFSPEDLFLIREGAAARRRFMDMSLCQLRPRYAEALAEYGRLYEHKTRILRDSDEYPQLLDTLPDFDRRLCQVGAVLISYPGPGRPRPESPLGVLRGTGGAGSVVSDRENRGGPIGSGGGHCGGAGRAPGTASSGGAGLPAVSVGTP